MKTELLAPAKNIHIAKQAIDCGADAVYIGAISYGARQNASNSIEDIAELVKYAHKFYVKVYVTLNTIITDNEIDDVIQIINKLYEIGVDALIIQDMAIINLAINNKLPPIPLHISTQCNNKEPERIKFFADIGLPRVVLARELTINQIRNIQAENPNLEIECFIHGALCVSYSGQCYLSHFIGNRSANKGECAQPCRKKYTLIDENGNIIKKDKHLLSLKDFNTIDLIHKLVDIGVKSFKIEGRLKDELYVRNVVGAYRQKLDKITKKTSSGCIDLGFEPDLNKSFNRGYTHYFLEEREKCFNFNSPKFIGEKIGTISKVYQNCFEIDFSSKNVELHKQDGLCFNETFGCIINKVESNKVYPNSMKGIEKGIVVFRNADIEFENTVLKASPKRQIGASIVVENNLIRATDEDKNTVSLTIQENEKANNAEKMIENFEKSFSKTGEADFYIQNIKIMSELPFLPISKINEYRRTLFEKLMNERLKNYKKEVAKPLKHVDYYKKKLDYRANVHNLEAERFYQKCKSTTKEFSFESKKPTRQVELMRTKHCLKYAFGLCKTEKKLTLIDEKGVKYPLKFDCKNCEMAILSPD